MNTQCFNRINQRDVIQIVGALVKRRQKTLTAKASNRGVASE